MHCPFTSLKTSQNEDESDKKEDTSESDENSHALVFTVMKVSPIVKVIRCHLGHMDVLDEGTNKNTIR